MYLTKLVISIMFPIFLFSCSAAVDIDNLVVDSKYIKPEVVQQDAALIFLGGSEGGMPKYSYRIFTELGYPILALAYYKSSNTPKYLEMIPLEYFEKAIKEFQNEPDVKGKKIVVIGTSKGGELALLLGSVYPQINGVVANVPASVAFQSINFSFSLPKSSWSKNGKAIPYVKFSNFDKTEILGNNFVDMYIESLSKKRAVKKATIKVENINGPILLLSGEDDIMWPSTYMCDQVVKRLKDNNFQHAYDHISYEDAGHGFFYGITHSLGGTSSGNKYARKDSYEKVLSFLSHL